MNRNGTSSLVRLVRFAILVGLMGCGNNPSSQLVPVRGKVVTANHRPIPGVVVQFIPDPGKGTEGKMAEGITDQNGFFSLHTSPHGDGAFVGHYKVTVERYYMDDSSIPEGYRDAARTPLAVQVQEGGSENLELKVVGFRKR